MNYDESRYYSMEFIEEDGKLYVLFYNDKDELVAKKEIPKVFALYFLALPVTCFLYY